MHQHYTVHFAKGALPPRIAAERCYLDPELGHRKGRGSVLGGGPGSKEGWLRGMAKQKKTLRPQERKATSTHHRGVCTWGHVGPWEAHLACPPPPAWEEFPPRVTRPGGTAPHLGGAVWWEGGIRGQTVAPHNERMKEVGVQPIMVTTGAPAWGGEGVVIAQQG